MTIWAITDLHLSLGVPNKSMAVFGDQWVGCVEKMQRHWSSLISSDDLVLIAGDISWAMKLEDAVPDLQWIHNLPGTKVLIKGNHDYWWTSLNKVEKILPSSCHLIQNNAFHYGEVSIAGTRLWDSKEYSFNTIVEMKDSKGKSKDDAESDPAEDERIFVRELGRLETSLKCLRNDAKVRIAMTHYPPIGVDLANSRVSQLLDKYDVDYCVFGHLHNVKPGVSLFGKKNKVTYALTACDYLNFIPLKLRD